MGALYDLAGVWIVGGKIGRPPREAPHDHDDRIDDNRDVRGRATYVLTYTLHSTRMKHAQTLHGDDTDEHGRR